MDVPSFRKMVIRVPLLVARPSLKVNPGRQKRSQDKDSLLEDAELMLAWFFPLPCLRQTNPLPCSTARNRAAQWQ